MEVRLTLTNEQLSDVLCSALEGGSNYWYTLVGVVNPTVWEWDSELECGENRHWFQDYPFNPGGGLLISDGEGVMCLDAAAIEAGLTVLAERYPWHLGDIQAENADADTGDAFLQCCLFGDVIYG